MGINDLLEKRGLTKYRVAVQAGIPRRHLVCIRRVHEDCISGLCRRYA